MGGLSANQPQCRITVRLEWTLLAEHMWHIQGTWPCFCLSRWIYQTYSSGPPQAHCWYQSSGDCLCTVWRSCPPSRCAPSEDRMFSHILDAYYLPLNPFATYIIWVWTDMDLNRSMACVQRAIQPWGRDSRVFFFFLEHMKDWLIIFPEGNVQQPSDARRQLKRAAAAAGRSFVWLSYCGISAVVKSMCAGAK